MKHNKIVLIGFMGSGKTTMAKKLAKKINVSFFDLDHEIEKQENLSIPQLFEQKGEDYFRKVEKAILKKTINKKDDFVLSVGGGTPCFFDNMAYINTVGTSIYLKYNAGILTSRLMNATTPRPLIKNLNKEELKLFVSHKLAERELFYKQSKLVVEGNNLKTEDLERLLWG